MARNDIRVKAEIGDNTRRAVEAALLEAARVYLKAAKQHARHRSGALRRNIVIKKAHNVPPGTLQYIIGVRTKRRGFRGRQKPTDTFYWRFLEQGWRPRGPGRRQVRPRRSLRRISETNDARKRQFPFLEPAFKSASGAALKAFYQRLQVKLDAS